MIKELLEERLGLSISSLQPISGGDINHAALIHIRDQPSLFVKYNQYPAGSDMLSKEAKGLEILDRLSAFSIPKVHHCESVYAHHFLVMDYIQQAKATDSHWLTFGERLADMHRQSQQPYGLDHDNYIGSLPQSNQLHTDWHSFYYHERLLPQLKLGIRNGVFHSSDLSLLQQLYQVLPELVSTEGPALLHGDLWSGNYLMAEEGITLIDPAVYYGDREMDLAMMRLFGGFPASAYAAYQEAYPLPYGYQKRIDLYQLYPIMVHANLFGGQYIAQARQIIKSCI